MVQYTILYQKIGTVRYTIGNEYEYQCRTKVIRINGFYNSSVGQSIDTVSALALCRGDVERDACAECVRNATFTLRELCPIEKIAIVWYDNCMLRYSTLSIFHNMTNDPYFIETSPQMVVSVPQFNEDLRTLVDALRTRAAGGGSLRKFATGNISGPDFLTIYGLLQCTPDISEEVTEYDAPPPEPAPLLPPPSPSVAENPRDLEMRRQLDWSRQHKIIAGTAKGMLYLHEDSRIFKLVVYGCSGYMSPEYAMHGHFSVKFDMFNGPEHALDLICHAWELWMDERALELIDPCLKDSFSRNEMIRCIHMGLLCVKEEADARPIMATIVLMLSNYSISLPSPQKPPFFI
ncbi:hypothetical protein LguiA_012655 [Lonicera macranthoides]